MYFDLQHIIRITDFRRLGSIILNLQFICLITKKQILVDIAGKSESAIPIEEFQFSKELDKLKIGAEVDVMLETLENKHGQIVVSRERAKRELSWKKMLSAFEKKN